MSKYNILQLIVYIILIFSSVLKHCDNFIRCYISYGSENITNSFRYNWPLEYFKGPDPGFLGTMLNPTRPADTPCI